MSAKAVSVPAAPGLWSTIGVSAGVLAIVFGTQLAVLLILAGVTSLRIGDVDLDRLSDVLAHTGFYFAIATSASGVFGLMSLALFSRLRAKPDWRTDFALRRARSQDWLFGLGAISIVILLSFIAGRLLDRPVISDAVVVAYQSAHVMSLFWVAVVIVAPVFEEVLCRGWLYGGLAASRLGHGAAIAVSALIWTGIHTHYDTFDLSLVLCVGLVLGAVRARSGSVYPCIGLHMLFNLVTLLTCVAMLPS